MDNTPDLPFINIHNPFTNEKSSVFMDKHNCMSSSTKDYFIKHISHMTKGMVLIVSAYCLLINE